MVSACDRMENVTIPLLFTAPRSRAHKGCKVLIQNRSSIPSGTDGVRCEAQSLKPVRLFLGSHRALLHSPALPQ